MKGHRISLAEVYPYALYKLAWTYYNLKASSSAISKLEEVIKVLQQQWNIQTREK